MSLHVMEHECEACGEEPAEHQVTPVIDGLARRIDCCTACLEDAGGERWAGWIRAYRRREWH